MAEAARLPAGGACGRLAAADWPLALTGLVLLYAPTVLTLYQTVWRQDEQAHGAIIFAVCIWLAWRKLPTLRMLPETPMPMLGGALVAMGLAAYVLGRSQSLIQFEVGSLIPVAAGCVLLLQGSAALRALWFPLFFAFFMIPWPGVFVQALTMPLKLAVSHAAEALLYAAGYPVARSGAILGIGPYQLLVADACAGLNSLFTLEALGLLYLNLTGHENPARNATLAALIVPISFVANVTRVIVLILVTYYFGDAVGQGFTHTLAGLLLFLVGLTLILSLDGLLGRTIFRGKASAS